jgi:hypothetical protein
VGLLDCDGNTETVPHGVGLMLGETLGLCETEVQKLLLSVPDTLTLEEEECEGLKEPVMVGLGLSVEEAVLVRQSEGLPLTVDVGLKEDDAQ